MITQFFPCFKSEFHGNKIAKKMAENMRAQLTHHPALMFSAIPDAFQDGVLLFDSRRGTAGHHIRTLAFQKPNPRHNGITRVAGRPRLRAAGGESSGSCNSTGCHGEVKHFRRGQSLPCHPCLHPRWSPLSPLAYNAVT